MSVYKSPESYIHRTLVAANQAGENYAECRLAIDLADLLTGPTSAHNARRLSDCIVRQGGYEVVEALEQACKRFRGIIDG